MSGRARGRSRGRGRGGPGGQQQAGPRPGGAQRDPGPPGARGPAPPGARGPAPPRTSQPGAGARGPAPWGPGPPAAFQPGAASGQAPPAPWGPGPGAQGGPVPGGGSSVPAPTPGGPSVPAPVPAPVPGGSSRPPPDAQRVPQSGVGRATHRGGGRGEPRPRDTGSEAALPTQAMGDMSLTRGQPGQRGRSRGGIVVQEMHTRPAHIVNKMGEVGNPITLVTNMFRLETRPQWVMFQYHVDFNPDIQNTNLRRRLVKDHRELLGGTMIFDGMTLFLPKRLPDTETEVFSQMPRDGTNVRLTIKLTNELPPTSATCIQMLNIMLRRHLSMMDMKLIGRHHYSPAEAITIPRHNMEVWPGFITSILKYETDILLLADISHKVLRIDSVLDDMYMVYNACNKNYGEFTARCTKKLIGEIVLTKYNNRTYRIDEIDWDKNPLSTFPLHNGTEITFKEYYEKSHNIDVHDLEQPLIVSRPKKKDIRRGMEGNILLLPELCTLTGLSEDMRADFRIMKDLSVHTRVMPEQRFGTLQKFITNMNSNEQVSKDMAGWGVRFGKSLLELKGRLLPKEEIMLANENKKFVTNQDADWSRDMRSQRLRSTVDLRHWCLIVTRRDSANANDFIKSLIQVAGPMGIDVSQPLIVELQNDRTVSYVAALKNQVTAVMQMAVCVVPNKTKDRYDAIKKLTCIEHPVPSQVIVNQTLAKKANLMSVSTKIAIQLNCKLGGEVWCTQIPLRGLMVVGFDTYHDSSKKGRSVGGLVASMNGSLTKYYSRVTFQHNHEELINGLKPMFVAALKKYHEVNEAMPQRIVIYRDGVGDGQLPAVMEFEIPQIQSCFQIVDGYDPKLTIVVVKKRISTRFFHPGRGGLGNPPPGTLIDKVVTRPEWYDFFLVSQAVKQGTVTPTHYNVVYDNSGMKPDHVQRLTYKTCHLYYNWQGTIRVPAPCQYAHKLAFLVGQSLHASPSTALSDKLFFL